MFTYSLLLFISILLVSLSIIFFSNSCNFIKAQESREHLIVVPEPGNYNITEGTDRNNIIVGNGITNVIVGEESDDVLMGRQGNDELHGNLGNDILQGSSGADI
jgi:Ca2+-binding RTX toxin-like protein